MRPTCLNPAGAGLLTAALLVSFAGCAGPPVETADLVLHGGKVVTVDDAVPDGEAVAVRDGKILAVGSNSEIDAYIGTDTEVIDLEGRLAIPGFIDSHVHFSGIGTSQLQLNLMDVANWDEVVEMVAAAVAQAEPGEL
ncbi:amidohydrolase family protein, partial [Gemmatimonadota bacterium]